MSTIGERIRAFATYKYGKINDFADSLGMGAPNVQAYMRGARKPGSAVLQKIQKLGCNLDWLLTGEGEMYAVNDNKTEDKQELNAPSIIDNLYSNAIVEKERKYLLPAVGRRMAIRDEGIHEGDLLIIDPNRPADIGDIVLKSTPDGMEIGKFSPGEKQPMGCLVQLIRYYPTPIS